MKKEKEPTHDIISKKQKWIPTCWNLKNFSPSSLEPPKKILDAQQKTMQLL